MNALPKGTLYVPKMTMPEIRMKELEGYIYEAISKNSILQNNMLYCGMSLAGTKALKLAAFSQTMQSTYKLVPKAIAICDAPPDMVRTYRECKKASEFVQLIKK